MHAFTCVHVYMLVHTRVYVCVFNERQRHVSRFQTKKSPPSSGQSECCFALFECVMHGHDRT